MLKLCREGQIELPSSIVMLPKLERLSVEECEELQFSKWGEGEKKVSSNVKCLKLTKCKISNEFLRISLTWFANVEKLVLCESEFTILPACIKECLLLRDLYLQGCRLLQEIRGIPPNIELFYASDCTSLKNLDLTLLPACTKQCRSLRSLWLNGCKNLEEIRGIPPNLEFLYAENCKALTPQCRSTLLNEVLYEAGGEKFCLPRRKGIPEWYEHQSKKFCLPGTRIPEWFEHQSKELPISFWFRNKLPAISLCFVARHSSSYSSKHSLELIINGKKMSPQCDFSCQDDHIVIFHLKRIQLDKVLLENEWNHVFFIDSVSHRHGRRKQVIKPGQIQAGLHVLEQKCSMDYFRFCDPYKISAIYAGGSSSSFYSQLIPAPRVNTTFNVILSYRGVDSYAGFTEKLWNRLREQGLHIFRCDGDRHGGEEIIPSCITDIENSRTAIVVFSKNYASSSFCLDALVNIVACIKDKGRFVLPVFYDVDPSHLRHQSGSYQEAVGCNEKRFKNDTEKLQKWRMALHQAADFPGYRLTLGDGYEHDQSINSIMGKVCHEFEIAHY